MTETVCETSGFADASTSVFVDASGRRRRRMKLAGYAVAAICGCYMIGVGSVVASNPRSPLASLPVAGVLGDTFATPTGAGAGGSLLNGLVDVASGVSHALSDPVKAVPHLVLSDRVLDTVHGVAKHPRRDIVPKGLPGIVVTPHGGSVAGSGGGGTAGGAGHGTSAGSQSPAPTGNGAPAGSSPTKGPAPKPTPQQLPTGEPPPPPSSAPPSTDPTGTNPDTPPATGQPSDPGHTSAPGSGPAPGPGASGSPAPRA